MRSSQAFPAAKPGHRLLPIHAVVGRRAPSRWGSLKFRPSASGARLRVSIWVRHMHRRSKRVFLSC